jgi:peptide-methionine (R)-S-oxide reductase
MVVSTISGVLILFFSLMGAATGFVVNSKAPLPSLSARKDNDIHLDPDDIAEVIDAPHHHRRGPFAGTSKRQTVEKRVSVATSFMMRPSPTRSQDSTRRSFWEQVSIITCSIGSVEVGTASKVGAMGNSKSRIDGYAVQKNTSEWRSMLSPAQFDVLRNGGTERPFSSILENEERAGIFACAGCDTPLFDAKAKFHSGTGWPSFATALPGVEVETVGALQASVAGAELRCTTCGGHLGDVFNDGFLFVGTPAFQSGKRFCIDGAALVFLPANGEAAVLGDKPPLPKAGAIKVADWFEPPKITSKSREEA